MVLLKRIKSQLLYIINQIVTKLLLLNFMVYRKFIKRDVPLRPTVFFIGAPTYCLAKVLVRILSPLLSLDYTVQNST